MDKIILPQAELYFLDESIIKIDMISHDEMDLEQMKILISSIRELAGEKIYSTLTDLRNSIGSATNEARQYAADNSDSPNKIANAIVLNSLAKKLMANFYIQFNKPKSPTKTFTSEEAALKWLRNFKKNSSGKERKLTEDRK